MDTLKIGIIGFGKMGRIRAAEIAKRDDTVLVCASDPHFEGDPPEGVRVYEDMLEVIASDVDAIFVCTPNRYAPEAVIKCLDAGKHVFCEKPPGRTLADIEAIRLAEKRNPGLKLKFGFNHRYHAGISEAKKIVESNELGPILFMRGIYGKSGGTDYEQSWRNSREISGGGILLDQGIHMLDLFRHFCGDFVEFKSMVSQSFWECDVEDNAFAMMRDTQGRVATIHSSATQWKHRFNLELFMADGYLSINGILSSTRSYGDETLSVAQRQFGEGFATGKPREEVIYFDRDPSWELELDDFVTAITGDKPLTCGTSLDAYKAMEMVFNIYEEDRSWPVRKDGSTEIAEPPKRMVR
jgi:predicted dehydrogenase